jgi:hypothetical protein
LKLGSRPIIETTNEDFLEANAEALVNTLNGVGYMGKAG